jgi:hypothetical protein
MIKAILAEVLPFLCGLLLLVPVVVLMPRVDDHRAVIPDKFIHNPKDCEPGDWAPEELEAAHKQEVKDRHDAMNKQVTSLYDGETDEEFWDRMECQLHQAIWEDSQHSHCAH